MERQDLRSTRTGNTVGVKTRRGIHAGETLPAAPRRLLGSPLDYVGLYLLFMAVLILSVACSQEVELDEAHSGWAQPDCFAAGCHTDSELVGPDHAEVGNAATCVDCHGGNGACRPGSDQGVAHTLEEGCIACHGEVHDYNHDAECVACHYAAAGTLECQ